MRIPLAALIIDKFRPGAPVPTRLWPTFLVISLIGAFGLVTVLIMGAHRY